MGAVTAVVAIRKNAVQAVAEVFAQPGNHAFVGKFYKKFRTFRQFKGGEPPVDFLDFNFIICLQHQPLLAQMGGNLLDPAGGIPGRIVEAVIEPEFQIQFSPGNNKIFQRIQPLVGEIKLLGKTARRLIEKHAAAKAQIVQTLHTFATFINSICRRITGI